MRSVKLVNGNLAGDASKALLGHPLTGAIHIEPMQRECDCDRHPLVPSNEVKPAVTNIVR